MKRNRSKHRAGLVWMVFVSTWVPAPADAHLMTTGLGPVYDGMMHVLVSPHDLLALAMVAVLGAMNGPVGGRRALFSLVPAWLVAGWVASLGVSAASATWVEIVPIVSLLALGVLVAVDCALPAWLVSLVALAVGVAHGSLNGESLAADEAGNLVLAGITITVFAAVALAAGGAVSLRAPWTRIALRAGGSWTAAIGLLTLGWTLRS